MLWSVKFLRILYVILSFFRGILRYLIKNIKLTWGKRKDFKRKSLLFLRTLKNRIILRVYLLRRYKLTGLLIYTEMDTRPFLFRLVKFFSKRMRMAPSTAFELVCLLEPIFFTLYGFVLPIVVFSCLVSIGYYIFSIVIGGLFHLMFKLTWPVIGPIVGCVVFLLLKLLKILPIYGILHFISIFLMIAYFTLMERKIMASIQRRKGPNVNGFHGLLQPLSDGLKLLLKEIVVPSRSNKFLFIASPIFFLTIALSLWSLIPFGPYVVVSDPVYSNLMFVVISGTSIYGIIFAGWASNSKYPFLGALRAVAQMISYEVVLGFIVLIITLFTGSLNFFDIVNYQIAACYLIFPLFPLFIIYFIVILAETNRAPFDLAEAESELVAGYNVEYSGILFAMFFLAEYSNMIVLSAVGTMYFFGGWHGPFSYEVNFILKILCFMVMFVVVRAVLPRYRYDQLMAIGWRSLLPLAMALFLFFSTFFYLTDSFYQSSQFMHSPEVYYLSETDAIHPRYTKFAPDAAQRPYQVLLELRSKTA